ncbi:MAG: slipin family protein [Dehalococcoidia bacterium]|jgi:regulator of protease activity HflC (stomatin/prohibitin superfamily)
MTALYYAITIIAILLIVLASLSIRVVYQYEAGVTFRLGKYQNTRKPGLRFIIPIIDKMRKVDTRVVTMDVPSQEAITRDNVTVKVNAVVYFRVTNPEAAVIEVYNYMQATFQIAQTTLRSVLGQSDLDELLSHREKLNQRLQQIIDEQTGPWGIKVSVVEIKDVELPASMQRAMAAQAEAERDRRAKVVHAEGEFQAAQKITEAAAILGTEPAAIQLRYMQTLTQIATERTSTIIFPLPLEMLNAFMPKEKK